jgi:hypothetical protein
MRKVAKALSIIAQFRIGDLAMARTICAAGSITSCVS